MKSLKTYCCLSSIGYQRLLLGRKGVGKTAFLRIIKEEAKKMFRKSLITIYQEYLATLKSPLPSNLIAKELNLENSEN
jgi:ATPase subunit of ABC transporter with duplicated ATPase domains